MTRASPGSDAVSTGKERELLADLRVACRSIATEVRIVKRSSSGVALRAASVNASRL